MKIEQLWPTALVHDNFLNEFNTDNLLSELYQKLDFENLESDNNDHNLFENTHLNELQQFKNEFIIPKFQEYFEKVWGYDISTNHNFRLKSWLTPPRSGYSMPLHNHSSGQLSSCFYLSINKEDQGGDIRFYDPRGNFNRGYSFLNQNPNFMSKTISPQNGDYLIFPSSLFHDVSYYSGKSRIVLIVDLYLED